MARLSRFVIPGQPQHVIQRGNNRDVIFVADEDYQYYLQKLGDACKKYDCEVHTYVLMTNHIHLLITPHTENGIRLTPLYDYLNTSIYGVNASVMALSMLPNNKETSTFNQMVNGYYYYADFLELGISVGLSEKFIAKSISTLTSKMDIMLMLVNQSYLSEKRKQQFIELFSNRILRLVNSIFSGADND